MSVIKFPSHTVWLTFPEVRLIFVSSLIVIKPFIASWVQDALPEVVVSVYKNVPEVTVAAPFNVIFLSTGGIIKGYDGSPVEEGALKFTPPIKLLKLSLGGSITALKLFPEIFPCRIKVLVAAI